MLHMSENCVEVIIHVSVFDVIVGIEYTLILEKVQHSSVFFRMSDLQRKLH